MARLDNFVPANHPLRPIRIWLNDALKRMDPVFARMYESDAKGGPPEHCPGEADSRVAVAGAVFDSKRTHADGANLLQHAVSLVRRPGDGRRGVGPLDVQQEPRPAARSRCHRETVETAQARGHLSGEHFSVDGTLIQAWAGHKSFVRKN